MAELENQNDIVLLNRIITLIPIDAHFREVDICQSSDTSPENCHRIISFLRKNHFVKTGIYSQLQSEENHPIARLILTSKGIELLESGGYENYLKKKSDENNKISSDASKNNWILIFTIIGAVAAVIAAIASLIPLFHH